MNLRGCLTMLAGERRVAGSIELFHLIEALDRLATC